MFKSKPLKLSFSFISLVIFLVISLVLLAGCSNTITEPKTGAVALNYAEGFQIENVAGVCQKVTDGQGRILLLCLFCLASCLSFS